MTADAGAAAMTIGAGACASAVVAATDTYIPAAPIAAEADAVRGLRPTATAGGDIFRRACHDHHHLALLGHHLAAYSLLSGQVFHRCSHPGSPGVPRSVLSLLPCLPGSEAQT